MKKANLTLVSSLAALALMQIGCTGISSGSSSSATTLTLSGSLASSAMMAKAGGNVAMDVDTTNLKVKAVAFTTPPTIVEADVNSDGSFEINLPNAKGASTTAYFLDKDDDSQQGVIVFEDTSSKDMNGNSSESSSVVLTGSVNLGSIALGSDGKVKVPVASIASQLGSSSSVAAAGTFDPTGTWYMKAFDGTLPTGYQTVGAARGGGPSIGFPITLARYTGKAFTKSTNCNPSIKPVVCDATADGTVGTNDRYALSIWGDTYSNGIGACGGRSGFTPAEARAYAGIHIPTAPTVDGNLMTLDAYVYGQPTGFGDDTAPFDKYWMRNGATLTRNLQNCRPTTITHAGNNYNGWACRAKVMFGGWPGTPIGGGTDVFGWQVGVEGGGCFNSATGKPVNVTNWGTIGMGNCTQTDVSSTYGSGFKKNTCAFTGVDHDGLGGTATISLTCTNTGGQVTDSAGAPTSTGLVTNPGEYLGQPVPVALSGATCESIGSSSDALTLAAYRCYAESLWNGGPQPSGSCTRDYHFNWAATTPAGFAQDSERGKPENAFVTNILNYSADGQTATLEDEQIETITINTGASSSTFCKASRRVVISFKKVSETRMLIDLRESGQMNSTNAACIGAAKDALAGKTVGGGDLQHILTPQNMIFYADTTL